MKITQIIVILIITLLAIGSASSKKNKSKNKSHLRKQTPKGVDLRNHYGTPNLSNQYGPQDDQIAQYVEANPDTFSPMLGMKNREKLIHANDFHKYYGYEEKLNPSPVKAGDYLNIAPSATKEINPEITGPKLEVNTEIEYPTAVKVPTFYGFAKEYHPVIAYDKTTGEIMEDNVLINRPIYNYENRVANVARQVSNHYDLRTGERITVDPRITTHGIDQIKDGYWSPPPKVDKCAKKTNRIKTKQQ